MIKKEFLNLDREDDDQVEGGGWGDWNGYDLGHCSVGTWVMDIIQTPKSLNNYKTSSFTYLV